MKQNEKMKLTIPNLLTFARIALIPVLVVTYYMSGVWSHLLATGIFVFAGLTDLFDGWLARRWNQTSPFGAFLDPVADKLIVATALVLLATDVTILTSVVDHRLFAVVCAIIIGREIVISGLREWMAEVGQRASVAVSYVGKFKTALQIAAISMMLFRYDWFGFPLLKMGEFLLYVATVMTLWSMGVYLKAAKPALFAEANRINEKSATESNEDLDSEDSSDNIHHITRE